MVIPRTTRSAVRTVTALVCVLAAAVPAAATRSFAANPRPAPGSGGAPRGATAARTASAWLPYWDVEVAYQDALSHASQLGTVSPFWYKIASAGRIEGHPGSGDTRIIEGLHRAGIAVVPTVMDMDTMESGELAKILTDPDKRAAQVETLLSVAGSHGYDGVDIDYETITPTPTATYQKVRAAYATFVTDLCAALHKRSKKCVITVSAQTAGTGRIWDYAAIGRAADRVRIMAYDLHWESGQPGPVSSSDWYDEILRRATALIPPSKIEMALPAYGWDWRTDGGGATRNVTWKEAEALRRKEGAPYQFDSVSGTPHFGYRDGDVSRTVWYQDARGTEVHLGVLRKYGVRNTGLWALGFEDPGVWKVLERG
ncbi:glycosyl hydrolase family 18 protein [Streptomyces sp. NBC_00344]|uniref:glycosyl hydrolase family 18 protein n=1 Tax=Streptomyces sp. NBC_00344 TaxID=2975720 RepID=UPI002E1E659E